MVNESMIQEAGRRLADAAGSDAQVILFGSHARGDAGPGSDLDLMVIEPEVRGTERRVRSPAARVGRNRCAGGSDPLRS
jgi:predicted nucleotidyltransferase